MSEENRDEGQHPLLSDFGLTPLQARLFVLLMSSDGLSTTEISKMTRVHRSDIYRALKSLTKNGLIEIGVGNPSRYYTTEPMKAVRLLLDSKRDELMMLESKTDSLVEWLEKQRGSKREPPLEIDDSSTAFRLIKGNAVIPRVIRSIQSARTEIIKVVSAPALRRHYIEFSECEKQAAARGVTVRVLTEIQISNFRVASSYAGCVHLRHLANLDNSLRYSVIDGSELILSGTVQTGRDEPDRSVLSTRNVVLVNGCISYFENLWSKSVGVNERLKVLSNSINRQAARETGRNYQSAQLER